MGYKNSIKILFSNFHLVWRDMLYHLIIFVLCGFFVYHTVTPIYRLLETSGFIDNVISSYTDFMSRLNLADFMIKIKDLSKEFIIILTDNMANIWINFVLLFLVIGFFSPVLHTMSGLAMCYSLNYYMGSMNTHSYRLSFSETFKKNLSYSLCFYLINLPITAVLGVIFVLSLKLFSVNWLVKIVALILVVSLGVIMLALRSTLFIAWAPAMVVTNAGVWKSLGLGIKSTFRRFNKVFPSAIGVVLTLLVVNLFLGTYTLGVGLLVSIPISYLLSSSLGMVSFFEAQGMRYYVDVYNVITPQKREKTDKLEDMKYVI